LAVVVRQLWHDWRPSLQAALGARAAAAARAVDRASGIYVAPRLHDARIAIKKLRYTTELGIATGVVKDPDLVRTMKDVQDVLGRLHDLQVLSKHLEHVDDRSGTSDTDLEVMTSIVHVDLAALHARYLRRRTRILEVCAVCHAVASETHALRTIGRATVRALPIVGVVGLRAALLRRQPQLPMRESPGVAHLTEISSIAVDGAPTRGISPQAGQTSGATETTSPCR
jgi:hypothetical protein